MPKKYFCDNIIGFGICGEEDPNNFYPGRYSKCKKCRMQMSKECLKEKKEMTKDEEMDKTIEKIKDGRLIQDLIAKMVTSASLLEEGLSISDTLYLLKSNITDCRQIHLQETKKLSDHIKLLNERIEYLQKENQSLKTNLSKINNFMEEKFNLFFDNV